MGLMSEIFVRAAQLGRTWSLLFTISFARHSTSRRTCGPAPGKPMSTESIPRASMRCRISILRSMLGVVTDGDCKPSRNVSSLSNTRAGGGGSPIVFQS